MIEAWWLCSNTHGKVGALDHVRSIVLPLMMLNSTDGMLALLCSPFQLSLEALAGTFWQFTPRQECHKLWHMTSIWKSVKAN